MTLEDWLPNKFLKKKRRTVQWVDTALDAEVIETYSNGKDWPGTGKVTKWCVVEENGRTYAVGKRKKKGKKYLFATKILET